MNGVTLKTSNIKRYGPVAITLLKILLVFSVTPFKIDQNQNLSIDKVQNLGNERRYIYKDPPQDSGQRSISYTRYPKKCFTQTYRDLYGDAMLVLTCMSSNMADGSLRSMVVLVGRARAEKPRGDWGGGNLKNL